MLVHLSISDSGGKLLETGRLALLIGAPFRN